MILINLCKDENDNIDKNMIININKFKNYVKNKKNIRSCDKYKKINDKIYNQVYAWMISFAPYENPKYAIAMIVEEGVSGGQTIAPRLSKLYKNIFKYDGSMGGEK